MVQSSCTSVCREEVAYDPSDDSDAWFLKLKGLLLLLNRKQKELQAMDKEDEEISDLQIHDTNLIPEDCDETERTIVFFSRTKVAR